MTLILRIFSYVHTFTYQYLSVRDGVTVWSPSFNGDRILFSFLKFAWPLLVNMCYCFLITFGSEVLWRYVLSRGWDVPWTQFLVVEILSAVTRSSFCCRIPDSTISFSLDCRDPNPAV